MFIYLELDRTFAAALARRDLLAHIMTVITRSKCYCFFLFPRKTDYESWKRKFIPTFKIHVGY